MALHLRLIVTAAHSQIPLLPCCKLFLGSASCVSLLSVVTHEIYCTPKGYPHIQYPQLNDSHDSQSPRATGRAGGRGPVWAPALLSLDAGNQCVDLLMDMALGLLDWFSSPQGCGVTAPGAGSIPSPHALIFTKSFSKLHSCLISLMLPFLLNPSHLWITKGSGTWFSGGLALVPSS